MSENWTFALSHVASDYFTVIGDDDGLLPHAISDLVRIVQSRDSQIVTWKKVEYCWPNHTNPALRHFLSLPVTNRLIGVPAGAALRDIYRFWLGYSRGPCIYNSLVATELIRKVEQRDGVLFGAICPDVYSSLALASVADSYLYSTRPFSVNGASAHSNGTSSTSMKSGDDRSAYEKFLSEIGEDHTGFIAIKGSINAAIADSLVMFSQTARVPVPRIAARRLFSRICAELRALPHLLEDSRGALLAQARRYGQVGQVERLCRKVDASKGLPLSVPVRPATSIGNGDVVMWGDRLDIWDVNAACQFVGQILDNYEVPGQVRSYSIAKRAFSRLMAKLHDAKFQVDM